MSDIDMDLSWFNPQALRPAKRQRIQDDTDDTIEDRRSFVLTPKKVKKTLDESATSNSDGLISSTTYSTHSPPALFSPKLLGRLSSVSSDASSNATIDNDDEDVIGDKEIDHLRYLSQRRLKSAWDSIFERYGRDMGDEADEIDLSTQQIVVDRGHLKGVRKQCRIGSLAKMGLEGDLFDAIDVAEDQDEDTDADADISSSDEQVETRIRTPVISKPFGQGAATKALEEAWTEYGMGLDEDESHNMDIAMLELPTLEEFLGHPVIEHDVEEAEEEKVEEEEYYEEGAEEEDEETDVQSATTRFKIKLPLGYISKSTLQKTSQQMVEDRIEEAEDENEYEDEALLEEDGSEKGSEAASEKEDADNDSSKDSRERSFSTHLIESKAPVQTKVSTVTPISKRRCACGKVFCFGCIAKSV